MPSRDVIEVDFRFPRSAEIRYHARPPAVGDLVHARHGQTWMVSEVHVDENHVYVATCVTPPRQVRGIRGLLGKLTRVSANSPRGIPSSVAKPAHTTEADGRPDSRHTVDDDYFEPGP